MIRIKIHRGTHQIGGCATEIECNGERILIDLGANLPGSDAEAAISDSKLLDSVFGTHRERHFDAILFSHYHGDHYGLYKDIPEGIPLYIGSCAKQILHIVTGYIDINAEKKGRDIIAEMQEYHRGHSIPRLTKMKITPFSVDHSALDAYMFLIEADGKRILFTGDFRAHGIANEREQLWRTLEKYVGAHIDILITEGTMLSRTEEADANIVQTEAELGLKAAEYFEEKKYNFVMVSSTNLDSIMEFYQNTPDDKMFICDQYQARVIMTAMENKGKEFWQYRSKKETSELYKKFYIVGRVNNFIYRDLQKRGEALKSKGLPQVYFKHIEENEIGKSGFVLLVRPNRFFSTNGLSQFERLFQYYSRNYKQQVNLIYSMWKGYLKGDKEDKDITRFIDDFAYKQLHTSGHAYVETIQKLLEKTEPDMIIPMHTEKADEFRSMEEFKEYRTRVKVLQDGETLES
ncbi:MAG: MBL fold metallo-hydrolase [Firmicutes bacterium]|nr:MBL fold metallo-hydrolase [Bacillota bacterium]